MPDEFTSKDFAIVIVVAIVVVLLGLMMTYVAVEGQRHQVKETEIENRQ